MAQTAATTVLRPRILAAPEARPPEFGNVVGEAIQRLIGAVLLEANDEWQVQHRDMQVEGMAGLAPASNE